IRPFDSKQLIGVLARILYDQPEPVDSLRPGVPTEWRVLLARMLAKEPPRRPAGGASLLRELVALPAPPDDAKTTTEMVETPEHSASDQVLVSVVLTIPNGADGRLSEALPLDSIRTAMQGFGCPFERLADGSLVATVLPKASATDQVRIAAR